VLRREPVKVFTVGSSKLHGNFTPTYPLAKLWPCWKIVSQTAGEQCRETKLFQRFKTRSRALGDPAGNYSQFTSHPNGRA